MNSSKLIIASGVTGLVMAGAITGQAFAWHPVAKINKSVQNQTTGSAMVDANDAASAVAAKPGDLLKYTIVVWNDGQPDSKGYNDLAKTIMSDTLPAGVELVSNPSQRDITENLGTLKPGQKVTKEYVVKVTSTKDKDLIVNNACVDGNSTANDNKQHQCDVADVKVSVPTPPVTPPTTPTPPVTPPQILAAATTLPNTGAGNLLLPAGIVGGLGYVGNMLRLKRRAAKQS
ncbi:MAG TPA: hypothetical protein VLH86_03730 [Patescibacteria group bacterium]|nr:hypothetical protein [Patescibacteria group bacterium]